MKTKFNLVRSLAFAAAVAAILGAGVNARAEEKMKPMKAGLISRLNLNT